ncbi:MAG: Stk1 family PASTA domain-containing Ser/Thr kinase [Propionibacteriaceae bacterium]
MTTTSSDDPLVGHVLDGRYEIISRIARGGMATVYVARDTRLARTVAVKVMHEGLGDDRDFARKFDREARAAARLVHPNIVTVFDQGVGNYRPYIVMEYVSGTTLRALITRDAPLPPQRAVALIEPVIAGLTVAHDNGYVHRDVKPENVLISDRGHVKVADFGLAKAITGDTMTATQGLLIGTVSYIPPELVAEGDADARSDVYSTGIVLFELLTGRKPHTGDTPIQVAYAHCNKDVPAPSTIMSEDWRQNRGHIPPYLDALVQSATARNPDLRPTDARVFLENLRLVKEALTRNVVDDPQLTAHIRQNHVTSTQPTLSETVPQRWKPVSNKAQHRPVTPISPIDIDIRTLTEPRPVSAPTPIEHSKQTASNFIAKPAPAVPVKTIRRRRLLVAAILLTLIGTITATGSWWLLAGQWTQAPNLAGMNRDEAKSSIDKSGLTVSFSDEFSENIPAGIVIRTAPEPDTKVKKGSAIAAFLSRGPERYAVPELVGISQSLAEDAVRGSNLSVGKVTQVFNETTASGIVVDTSTASGTMVPKNTAIDLIVSKGPAPIEVPQLTEKRLDEAKTSLEKLGLQVEVTEANSATVAKGSVISQSPDNGTLKKGDKVKLTVSSGPVMVEVPQTRLMTEAKAKEVITAAGFKVEVKSLPNPISFGMVSYSDPTGGSKAPQGSTITIYLV